MSTEAWTDITELSSSRPKGTLRALVRSPLILLLPVLALGLGVWWNWPWLAAEHERLEPWKVPIIWLGEFVALFWYLRFAVRYTLSWAKTGEGWHPPASRERRWGLVLLVLSLFLGTGADLAVTLITMFEEHSAHDRSQQAAAEILDGSVKQLRIGHGPLYTLSCRFRDPQGRLHEVTQFAGNKTLPAAVKQAVVARQFPVALDIRYDPDWPGRSWIDSGGDPHHNRLYFMSLSVILFQGILGLLLIILSREPRLRVVPPVEVCSFLAVALVLLLAGIGKLILGET